MKKITLFFLLLSSMLLYSQKEVKVDLSNPNSAIYTHLYFLQSDSYEPVKAATTIYGFQGEEAEEIAIKLKKILDGKGLKVDFSKVPTNTMYSDTTGYKIGNRYVLFPYQMPEIYVERVGGNWYYSSETTSQVNNLYKSIYPWHTEKLLQIIPEIGHSKILNIELWQYLGLLILVILCFILFFLLKKIVLYILRKIQLWIVHKSNAKIDVALKKLTRPIVLLIVIWFLKTLLPSLMLDLDVNTVIFLVLNIMVTVFWIYVFLKLVKVIMSVYEEFAESTHNKLDDQLVPILNNFLTGIVIFVGFLKMLTLFGIKPVTVIAGASIGGIAVALASQDTVKNLIGTIMIFIDKPFHIGDWIEAGEVVGTVETVGFRSTTVRAADTSVYQIPNSTLSEMVVNNKGLRAYRRYTTNLGLRYDTPPELIDAFVDGVRKIIKLHSATRDDAFNVEFSGFGDSSLLILVNVYFTALDWNKEQASKHSLHIAILKLAKEIGVDFAFPSTTVMIEQFPEKKGLELPYNIDEKRIQEIINNISKK
ncbi:mechanosensitive ion channel family protein [Lutibacter sp. TH_r2]|uniref:mechanosensitive ion channel family protein n=1 Tax=Lutibacter sp. TH_r2 TaxID=3082083 RepID=UPI002952F090|nr:mechanosensitive ion channel family protein [Lutibacter sp. TH_r2]MDV7187082.1 mechanosensitive ion channel family protein [Lutibacter sp. TH_r2]